MESVKCSCKVTFSEMGACSARVDEAVAGEGAKWGFPAEGVKEFWCSWFWMLSIEGMSSF